MVEVYLVLTNQSAGKCWAGGGLVGLWWGRVGKLYGGRWGEGVTIVRGEKNLTKSVILLTTKPFDAQCAGKLLSCHKISQTNLNNQQERVCTTT